MKKVLIGMIRSYQKIVRPFIKKSCRFYPSCSEYAIEAIDKKGILKGIYLSAWRILKCNPFNAGGFDPVERSEGK